MATQTLAELAGILGSVPLWYSGRAVRQWDPVTSAIDGEIYRRKTAAGAGTLDPADDRTNYNAVSYVRVNALPVRSRRSENPSVDPNYWANNAVKTRPASIAAGVRTEILSMTGRGNLQFAGVFLTTSAGNTRLEVICDGFTVLDTTLSAFASQGFVLAGMSVDSPYVVGPNNYVGVDYTAVPVDALPFRRTVKVFITPTSAIASPNLTMAHLVRTEG